MTLLLLAFKSLRSRVVTTSLTIFSIALSVILLVGVDRVREGTQKGFSGTISHTSLVVGARGGSLPLLLYAVFHIGTANNELSYASYQAISQMKAVKWTIPLSMGDSFHGFRVVATDDNFYEHYQYRGENNIEFVSGTRPEGIFEAALGSEVAKQTGVGLGQQITLSHGLQGSFSQHANRPFTVVGILKQTATPVDRSIYITLYGDEAMHFGWQGGAPSLKALNTPASAITKDMLHIDTISAFLVGTKLQIQTLPLMWQINGYKPEPLTAVIPATTLEDLWQVLGYADVALSLVSGAVLVVGLLAMLIALYTALNERRREVAVLRAVGLHARQIFTLFVLESTLISTVGMVVGLGVVYVLLFLVRAPVENHFGIPLAVTGISQRVAIYMIAVVVAGSLLGCIPAIRAYRNALVDGLSAG